MKVLSLFDGMACGHRAFDSGKAYNPGNPVMIMTKNPIIEGTKRLISPAAQVIAPGLMGSSEGILYYDPYRDPVNFVKKPFGTSAREAIRNHLSSAIESILWVLEIAERYPNLISEEDV